MIPLLAPAGLSLINTPAQPCQCPIANLHTLVRLISLYAQVKLFVELFSSKFQALWFKILRASGEDLKPLTGELERNLEVGSLGLEGVKICCTMQGSPACPALTNLPMFT